MTDEQWNAINAERMHLIDMKFKFGLSDEQKERLDELQKMAYQRRHEAIRDGYDPELESLRSENARLRDIAIAAKLMTEAVTRCPKFVAPCGQTIHSILGNTWYNNVPHTLMDDFLELFIEYQIDHGEEIARQAVAGGGEKETK